jgi:class 3 adenylate cyclase
MPPKRPKRKTKIPAKQVQEKVGEGNARDTIILFADIMGASEVSNHKPPKEYFEFVKEFQNIFDDVCKKYLSRWYPAKEDQEYVFQARGDEGLLMICPKKERDTPLIVGEDVDVAVNIGLALKRRWLKSKENIKRITESKLLPIDIGIGIHLGPTWIYQDKKEEKPNNPCGYVPEGYAINLAKRIESHSRAGKYTNIFVSSAAHGAWRKLPDEYTYIFDEQQAIRPKGITRNIPLFEVKHHYLPTDWVELSSDVKQRGKSLLDPEEIDPDLLADARELNPTNIWLAEESIRSLMLKRFNDLKKSKRDEKKERKKAFKEACSIAEYLANSDQQDAGILLIQGLIEGECLEFESEREKYKRAMELSPVLPEPYWYTALSYSYQIFYELNFDTAKKIDDLNEQHKIYVGKALKHFKEANARSFMSAWIPYDYGCELIRWAKDGQLTEGIQMIQVASSLYKEEVAESIKQEEYLKNVIDDPRIKSLLI